MRDENVVEVAVVSLDPALRLEVARAFDGAPASWHVTLHKEVPPEAGVIVATPEVECPDAIRFDPGNPDDALEAVAARLRAHGRVIVVSSPGGGAGATTVALHLAALGARHARSCYVDLDTNWGVADRLGFPPDSRTWADFGGNAPSLEACALPVAPGFRVLLAPRRGDHSVCDRLIAAAADSFELVVVDAPHGDILAGALEGAHCGVLVVSPTIPSARRGREMLAAHPDVPWAVVVNRSGPGGEVTRMGLQRILGCRIAVELPCCPSLRDREDEGHLLNAPWTRWTRRIARLYAALERA